MSLSEQNIKAMIANGKKRIAEMEAEATRLEETFDSEGAYQAAQRLVAKAEGMELMVQQLEAADAGHEVAAA